LTHLDHLVTDFLALHISEFYSHDFKNIRPSGPIALVEHGGACNLPPLIGCTAQNGFWRGVEKTPNLRHALVTILAKEGRWLIILR
jgi:hypothetical protein